MAATATTKATTAVNFDHARMSSGAPVPPTAIDTWDTEGAKGWDGCGKGKTSVVTRTPDGERVIKKVIDGVDAGVFEREIFWLKRLGGLPHFPRLLAWDPETYTLMMDYCGDQMTLQNIPDDAEAQMQEILATLQFQGCFIEDVMRRNILVRDGTLYLCDFGWSCTGYRTDPERADPTCGIGLPDVHKPTIDGEITANAAYLDMVKKMAADKALAHSILDSLTLRRRPKPYAVATRDCHTYEVDDFTGTNTDREGNVLGDAEPLDWEDCDDGIRIWPRIRGRKQPCLLHKEHPQYDRIKTIVDDGFPYRLTFAHARHKHPVFMLDAQVIEE